MYSNYYQHEIQTYPIEKVNEQPCLAQEAAKRYREQHNLPEGSPVVLHISCPCPNCTIRC